MPFGALDAHHNAPNKTLLTPGAGWMLGDGQDPLDAWDIDMRCYLDGPTDGLQGLGLGARVHG